jgi:hypothetical protein
VPGVPAAAGIIYQHPAVQETHQVQAPLKATMVVTRLTRRITAAAAAVEQAQLGLTPLIPPPPENLATAAQELHQVFQDRQLLMLVVAEDLVQAKAL